MARIALIPTLLLGLVLALTGCSRSPEEQRLRERIAQMQAALSEGQAAAFLRWVAEDFTAQDGALDRRGLELFLRAQLLRHQRIGVRVLSQDISLLGDRATVELTAFASAGSSGLLPEQAELWRVTSGWRRERGEWRVYSASWEPARSR